MLYGADAFSIRGRGGRECQESNPGISILALTRAPGGTLPASHFPEPSLQLGEIALLVRGKPACFSGKQVFGVISVPRLSTDEIYLCLKCIKVVLKCAFDSFRPGHGDTGTEVLTSHIIVPFAGCFAVPANPVVMDELTAKGNAVTRSERLGGSLRILVGEL